MNEEQRSTIEEIRELSMLLKKAIERAKAIGVRVTGSMVERHIPDIAHATTNVDLAETQRVPATLGEALVEVGFRPFARNRILVRERRGRELLKRQV